MKTSLFISTVALLVAAPAFAADLPAKKDAPAAPAAAPAPAATTDALTISLAPEFASRSSGPTGGIADVAATLKYAHTFNKVWVVGGNLAFTERGNGSGSPGYNDSSLTQTELQVSYNFDAGSGFTLVPTVGVGYGFGNPQIKPTVQAAPGNGGKSSGDDATTAEPYYYLTAAANYKIDSNWTVNLLTFRWRDSFDGTWKTPKISAGATYNISATDAVYASVGQAWKDYESSMNFNGDSIDKANIELGYTHKW